MTGYEAVTEIGLLSGRLSAVQRYNREIARTFEVRPITSPVPTVTEWVGVNATASVTVTAAWSAKEKASCLRSVHL